MKRRILHLSVAFLTCTIGLAAYGINSVYSDHTQSFALTIDIDNSTEMVARFDVTQSVVTATAWNESFSLTNTGSKVITGYELGSSETYDPKKLFLSFRGGPDFRLEPGQAKTINQFTCKYPSVISFVKYFGGSQKTTFGIKHLEFEDGTVADNIDQKLLPQD